MKLRCLVALPFTLATIATNAARRRSRAGARGLLSRGATRIVELVRVPGPDGARMASSLMREAALRSGRARAEPSSCRGEAIVLKEDAASGGRRGMARADLGDLGLIIERLDARGRSSSGLIGGSTIIGSGALPYLPPMNSRCFARLLRL